MVPFSLFIERHPCWPRNENMPMRNRVRGVADADNMCVFSVLFHGSEAFLSCICLRERKRAPRVKLSHLGFLADIDICLVSETSR